MPRSSRKMRLTAPIWTDPKSHHKGQVDTFPEHPVVRRVATGCLIWWVMSRNTAVAAVSPKRHFGSPASFSSTGPRS